MPSYATPEGKYYQQMLQARQRGIDWQFTFESWWAVWQGSGKWDQRGRRAGQYVMARHGDEGPYSPENVRICTTTENALDGFANGKYKAPPRYWRLGRGQGWSYIEGEKKPYQTAVSGKWVGAFETQAEAEAAYASAVAKRFAELQSTHLPT